MSNIDIVRLDDGGVNARILARIAKVDFRRVEAASLTMPVRFTSSEGKRFFLRLFNTLQLNAHFVSIIARTRLASEVGQIEVAMRAQMDKVADHLNQAIDAAEAVFRANGISRSATHKTTMPLEVEVEVLSSHGRRYLEVLVKMDQLMPLLQTLEILDIVSAEDLDQQRTAIKREVRNVANGARNFAAGLRRRMNAMDIAERASVPVKEGASPSHTDRLEVSPAAEGDLPDPTQLPAVAELAQTEQDAPPPRSIEKAVEIVGPNTDDVARASVAGYG